VEAIFRHPLAHNLDWRELVGLIAHIGQVEERSGGDCLFTVGAEHQFMRRPHHAKDLAVPDVMAVRHLLVRAGWSVSDAPSASAAPAPPTALIAHGSLGAGAVGP
jgi:hypothetical protein